MRIAFIILLAIASFQVIGQDAQTLTLETAVLKQGTDLRPEQLNGLGWLNSNTYLHYEGKKTDRELQALIASKGASKTLINLEQMQEKIKKYGKELKALPRFNIAANDLLSFRHDDFFFTYDTKSAELKSFGLLPATASDLHLNPQGDVLAYVQDNNIYLRFPGGETLRVTEDGNEDLVYGKAVSRFEFGISEGIFWSPEGNSLAFYRNDQTAVTSYPLVALDSTPAFLNNIKYPMAGGPSEMVQMLVYSRNTGKTVMLATDVSVDDDAYVCWGTWTPDEKQVYLTVLNRDQNKMRISAFEASTGKFVKTFYEESDPKYVEPLYPITFTGKDNSPFVFLSQKSGFLHIYRHNGKEVEQLTKGNWVVTSRPHLTTSGKTMFFEGTDESGLNTKLYQLDLKTGMLNTLSKVAGSHQGSFSPDGDYTIDSYSNLNTPHKVLLLDKNGKTIKELMNSEDPMKSFAVSRPELVQLKADDGTPLHGRLIKPHDFDPGKKYPVLVYVYNGPHVQLVRNSWWASAPYWMSAFAEKGYLVFTVDGRGSYNRGKEFEQVIFRQLGTVEMQDQLAGVKYLKSLNYVDSDKLAVHGWSFGGFMTASLMLRHPDVFKVGVAGGPVTDWKYYEVMYTERYMDTPQRNPEGFKTAALANYTQNLKGRLLLIHGLSDDVVVPQHNFSLIKKFVDDGVQIDFFPYPGHPHNVRGKDRLHLMEKILTYVEDHL